MEEEEYYDSIDDTEFEECRSFCNEKFIENDSDPDEDECNKLNELVPFYNGNVEKSEINSIKNDSKSNSVTALRNKTLKRRAPLTSLADQRKNRSYLTMFYAKTQQGKYVNASETSRATCTDISPKSNASGEQEDGTFRDTANSEKFLETINCDTDHCPYQAQNSGETCRCGSETTMASKLFSVSEAHFNSLLPSRERRQRDLPKDKCKTKPVKASELGGLGPNIALEKLELLRRRQTYGKSVSEKNRMKIMESKVIRKLRQEIRESNKL